MLEFHYKNAKVSEEVSRVTGCSGTTAIILHLSIIY